jgi:hypothetical protein
MISCLSSPIDRCRSVSRVDYRGGNWPPAGRSLAAVEAASGRPLRRPRSTSSLHPVCLGIDVCHLSRFGGWNGDVMVEFAKVIKVYLDAINDRHLVQ